MSEIGRVSIVGMLLASATFAALPVILLPNTTTVWIVLCGMVAGKWLTFATTSWGKRNYETVRSFVLWIRRD